MKKKELCISLGFLAAFGLWTLTLCLVDVRGIGPQGSAVGLAAMNQFVHEITGVNWTLYAITDWLGLVPLAIVAGFGLLGLAQWIHRKSLRNVDRSILVLGGFYLAVLATFVFFENVIVNFRPVLIEGILEASYPSSTTLLALCVVPTAMTELRRRMDNRPLRRIILAAMAGFTAFMVIGRLLSGVHWFSDIIGGGLLSAGLTGMYTALSNRSATR